MKKIKNYVKLFSLLLFLALASWGYYVAFAGNFATVEKGELYRSAQLDGEDIRYYVKKYGIKSILNLRGSDTDKWYQEEVQTSKEIGVVHYDLTLSAYHEPKKEDMDTLVNILKTAPKPLLIHCYGGADRTGLAVSLYEFIVKKESASKAKENFSILHGHLPYFSNETIAMDKAFNDFVITHP